jgi:hypothetical protein
VHFHDALVSYWYSTRNYDYYVICMGYIARSHCSVYRIAVVLLRTMPNARSNVSSRHGQAINLYSTNIKLRYYLTVSISRGSHPL